MTAVKVLTMLLGVATAIIAALVAGIISWWNNHTVPATLTRAGVAFAGALTLWLLTVQTYGLP